MTRPETERSGSESRASQDGCVALTFDLVHFAHATMDALQERPAFGTQSLACRNFNHSRLVDARGAEKQLRCGSGWHARRLPSH
jgi:hypothetical protein